MSENTPTQTPSTSTVSRNHLSSDVEIKGNITFRTDATIDGKVEGEISSTEAVLTLGENAEIHGEIKTRSVIVRGQVNGNITAAERCELRGKAELVGDLKARQLVMEENVTLVGKTSVNPHGHDISAASAGGNRPAQTPAPGNQQGLFGR